MLSKKPLILVIDDDAAFCRLVASHLEKANFEVVCANSAAEGLSYSQRNPVEVIVLDHNLTEQDGLSLLSRLQTFQGAPPIVYLTGSQDSRLAVAALKAGAADYVVKDVHGDFLILLENAVTNAMFATAIKRDKEKAEAEVRIARDQFKALAEERALLLREVSHRVSNSLQLIASLLHFQADISNNADVKAALKEANGRVIAVARVHRALHSSLDVRWVSLAEYLSNLISDLKDVAGNGGVGESTIAFASDHIQAAPDIAVSVGIIATELILNALKHAYPNGGGPVRVQLRAGASEIVLAVEDEGIGGLNDPLRQSGLGHRIIDGMADKLQGAFRYDPLQKGTRAVLTFPVNEHVRAAAEDAEKTASAA
ncbi:MAG TPA: response regulator [Hyphomicrobiales bacterium]|nr:response regulator [Hyphomicrobiales bacterium]